MILNLFKDYYNFVKVFGHKLVNDFFGCRIIGNPKTNVLYFGQLVTGSLLKYDVGSFSKCLILWLGLYIFRRWDIRQRMNKYHNDAVDGSN